MNNGGSGDIEINENYIIRIKTSTSPTIIVIDKRYHYVYKLWLTRESHNKRYEKYNNVQGTIQTLEKYNEMKERYDTRIDALNYEADVYGYIEKNLLEESETQLPFLHSSKKGENVTIKYFTDTFLEINNEEYQKLRDCVKKYLCSYNLHNKIYVNCDQLKYISYTDEEVDSLKINFITTLWTENTITLKEFMFNIQFNISNYKVKFIEISYLFSFLYIQVLYGLCILYSKRIKHGDLHTGNILLTKDFRVLIYDWDASYLEKIGDNPYLNNIFRNEKGFTNEILEDLPSDFHLSFINSFFRNIRFRTIKIHVLKILFPILVLKSTKTELNDLIFYLKKIPKLFLFNDGGTLTKHSEKRAIYLNKISGFFGKNLGEIFTKTILSDYTTNYIQNLLNQKIISKNIFGQYMRYKKSFIQFINIFVKNFLDTPPQNRFSTLLNSIVNSIQKNISEVTILTDELATINEICKKEQEKKDILKNRYYKIAPLCDKVKNKFTFLSYAYKDKKKVSEYFYKPFFIGKNKSIINFDQNQLESDKILLKNKLNNSVFKTLYNDLIATSVIDNDSILLEKALDYFLKDSIEKKDIEKKDIEKKDIEKKDINISLFNNIFKKTIQLYQKYEKGILEKNQKDYSILLYCLTALEDYHFYKLFDKKDKPLFTILYNQNDKSKLEFLKYFLDAFYKK